MISHSVGMDIDRGSFGLAVKRGRPGRLIGKVSAGMFPESGFQCDCPHRFDPLALMRPYKIRGTARTPGAIPIARQNETAGRSDTVEHYQRRQSWQRTSPGPVRDTAMSPSTHRIVELPL